MAVTWLHVSDFHFRKADAYDRNQVLKALVEAVARFRDQGRKPDLIFATGDIAHAGKPEDYAAAGAFFDHLLAAAGVDKRHFFVVPGNHDVDRDKSIGLSRTLGSGEDPDKFFDPARQKHHITEKLGAFAAWYDAFFDGIRTFPDRSSCGPVEAVTINALKIAVLPLNSALFCCADDDQGKLWLGRRCLEAALAEAKGLAPDLTVALIHHPLDWLCETEQDTIKATLFDAVDVVLRGHLHKPDAESSTTVGGTTLALAAGATYQTRKYPNRALYVTVADGAARIFPIHYVDSPRAAWVLDTGCFPFEPNYEGVLPLPRLATPGAPGAVRATTDPPRPTGSDAGRFRFDTEIRFRVLKGQVGEALAKSHAATGAVARTLGRPGTASDPDALAALVDHLIDLPFDRGTTALTEAHVQMMLARNQPGVAAIRTVGRLLIPWLYVASNNIFDEQWESVGLGDLLQLPAGIETFAELVMAGLDRREVAYQAITDTNWPRSRFALRLGGPESGIKDATEANLRHDLFRRLDPAPEFKTRSDDDKDQAIDARLEHFVKRKGIRFYVICPTPIGGPGEITDHREMLARIARRYRFLVLVQLDGALALDHQKLFDDIRHLLEPNRTD